MEEEKFPKKNYCCKSDCKAVQAGFHLEQYFCCSTCKLEISEDLYKRIEAKDKLEETIEKEFDEWELL